MSKRSPMTIKKWPKNERYLTHLYLGRKSSPQTSKNAQIVKVAQSYDLKKCLILSHSRRQERRSHHLSVRIHRLQTDRTASRPSSSTTLPDRHLLDRKGSVHIFNRLVAPPGGHQRHRSRPGSASACLVSVFDRRRAKLHLDREGFGHRVVS